MQSWKQGFTLAEVLITLGIIGVVAAITVPVLMQNIQDKQFKEAAKAAYSKVSQAINMMKADNDSDLKLYFANASSWTTFRQDLTSQLKIVNDCYNSVTRNNQGCVTVEDYSSVYDTLYQSNNPAQTYCFTSQFITADGMFWGIQYNTGSYYIIAVDVNGYQKGPNVFGRDTFVFELFPNGSFVPMGAAGTYYAMGANDFCNRNTNIWGGKIQGYGCMYYVMQGKDY